MKSSSLEILRWWKKKIKNAEQADLNSRLALLSAGDTDT